MTLADSSMTFVNNSMTLADNSMTLVNNSMTLADHSMTLVNNTVNSSADIFTENSTHINESDTNIPLLAQSHVFFKASQAVNNYYAPCIIALGLVGNTLSFLVMLQVSVA